MLEQKASLNQLQKGEQGEGWGGEEEEEERERKRKKTLFTKIAQLESASLNNPMYIKVVESVI